MPSGLSEILASRAFGSTRSPDVAALAEALVRDGGGHVLGIIFFGSRKTQASPDAWSAYDLFVVTREYLGFYQALRASGSARRSPYLQALLNRWLAPSQVAFSSEEGGVSRLAKCAVISLPGLVRETSRTRRDHFCIGRLFQPAEVVYVADADTRERLLAALENAQLQSYAWVRPWLPESFDAVDYYRTLLSVSLGREIRPESSGRAEALWRAQAEHAAAVTSALLRQLCDRGDLTEQAPGRYSRGRRVGLGERLRLELYFRWSTVRATARWAKHVLTFEGWLDYVVRKARRHSGQEIVLSARERRWPVIFLWPRLFRFLRNRDR